MERSILTATGTRVRLQLLGTSWPPPLEVEIETDNENLGFVCKPLAREGWQYAHVSKKETLNANSFQSFPDYTAEHPVTMGVVLCFAPRIPIRDSDKPLEFARLCLTADRRGLDMEVPLTWTSKIIIPQS